MNIQKLQEQYQSLLVEIASTPSKWVAFLRVSATLYKYSFPNQVLLYGQVENPTAIASFDQWNGIQRKISRGATGAYCFTTNERGYSKKYFDVADTYGTAESYPLVWKANTHQKTLHGASALIDEYQVNDYTGDSRFDSARNYKAELQYMIRKLAVPRAYYHLEQYGYTKPEIQELQDIGILNFITDSVIFTVLDKSITIEDTEHFVSDFEQHYEYHNLAESFTDLMTLHGIGTILKNTSTELLNIIERGIQHEHTIPFDLRREEPTPRENNQGNDLHPRRGFSSLFTGRKRGRANTGTIRPTADESVGIELSEETRRTSDDRRADALSANGRQSLDGDEGSSHHPSGELHGIPEYESVGENLSPKPRTDGSGGADTKGNGTSVDGVEDTPESQLSFEAVAPTPTLKELLASKNLTQLKEEKIEPPEPVTSTKEEQAISLPYSPEEESTPQSSFPDVIEEVGAEPIAIEEEPEDTSVPDQEELMVENEPEPVRSNNFFLTQVPEENINLESGAKARFQDNITAIETLQLLEKEERTATTEEQLLLAKYAGWGGLSETFDESKSAWSEEYQRLKKLLPITDYQNARASTLSSFYTPTPMITAIHETVGRFGLSEQARILDPSMGTGRFFATLPEKYQTAHLTGVEIDSLSAHISSALFPDVTIHNKGYERTDFLNEQFDYVVSNIPFGNFRVSDSDYDKHGFLIHDYFFAKSLDKVRQGGIVAFITSSGTLDKQDSSLRKHLAKKANLIGAVRLPNNAFDSAGTKVTTDIILLQKRYTPRDLATDYPNWIDTEVFHQYEYESGKDTITQDVTVNRYFMEHPEFVLGSLEVTSSAFGKQMVCLPKEDSVLEETLQTTLEEFHAVIPPLAPEELEEEKTLPATSNVKNYSFTVLAKEDGTEQVYYRENTRLYPMDNNKVAVQRIKEMDTIRRVARGLTELQASPHATDEQIKSQQDKLNHAYDTFVKKFGSLHQPINKRLFSKDVDANFILALECKNPENKDEYIKEAIFSKRTIEPVVPITSAENAHDAMYVVLSETGKLNFHLMAELYDKPIPTMIEELGTSIYRNPALITEEEYSGWERDVDYLSGDIPSKIKQIEYVMSQEGGVDYSANLEALKKVMPKPLRAGEIVARIGATWIPTEIYNQFIWETFKTPSWQQSDDGKGIAVQYNPHIDKWNVTNQNRDNGVEANTVFGTERISAYHIFQSALNLDKAKVYDRIDDKSVINDTQTKLARGKQAQIEQAFSSWIFKDADRRHELEAIYNRVFNSIALKQYDGSHLALPHLSKDFTPYVHQRNAVARIIDNSAHTLLDHEVGTGKTGTMIIGAHERLRLGLSNRVMFVVPNHIVEQFGQDIYKLYPTAKAMVTSDKDFEKNNRQEFLSRIAMSDANMIVLGHTQFTRIEFSPDHSQQALEEEIQETMLAITQQKQLEGAGFSIKKMETTLQNLRTKLEKSLTAPARDEMITFEELGADTIMVDEADLFKNCRINTKMYNVAGIGTSDSQRADDMLMKTRYVDDNNGKIVFATGTVISNAASEFYVMQRYLQEKQLKAMGIFTFDQWVSNFASTTTSLELSPEGNGHRPKTRLSKYYNLPELMKTYGIVADCVTADETEIERPALETGKPMTIVNGPSLFQEDWMSDGVIRCKNIRDRLVTPEEDNMLVFSHEAKLLSIDERLIDPTALLNPRGKLSTVADNVLKYYKETTIQQGTQLIFSDMGTPKPLEFNVYDELKQVLVAKGIPSHEIKFIHEANNSLQKEALFEQVRQGTVRVLIASTGKCGAGTNIQDRLRAIHHLDCPYRPRDLTQRNGRGWRQGNMFPEIAICQYVTKRTFDAYSWSILARKQTFIEQIRKGSLGERTFVDQDSERFNYETVQAIATGNPLMQEKMTVDNQVNNLQFLLADFNNQQYRLEDNLKLKYPKEEQELQQQLAYSTADKALFEQHANKEFAISLKGRLFEDRVKAGEILIGEYSLYQANTTQTEDVVLGEYKGFAVSLTHRLSPHIKLTRNRSYVIDINVDSPIGTITRIENILERIPNMVEEQARRLEEVHMSMEQAEEQLTAEFPHTEELNTLLARQAEIDMELNLKDEDELVQEVGEVEVLEQVQEVEMALER